MSWLRIDDGFAEHRKLLQLKRADRWTWMELLCYCARQADNGRIPEGISETMRAVTAGFLEQCATIGLLDIDDGGYIVHDWAIYNPKDATNAARQQRHRNAKRNGQLTETVTDQIVTTVTPPAQARARVPSRPHTNTNQPTAANPEVGRSEYTIDVNNILKKVADA